MKPQVFKHALHSEPIPELSKCITPELSGMLRVLTCGSVDDGKSTLIGRLLWDATDLYDDQRRAIQAEIGRAHV